MPTSQGLICPNCASVVPIAEGARIVACPSCGLRSLVQGERGIRRWQVGRQTERPQAEQAVRGFWRGINKAMALPREAQIKDLFLIYLPYWRVQAFVVGWLFGRVRKDKDSTKPVEVEIFEEMHWNDAAVDVAEYGVNAVRLSKEQLQPYDHELLHSEAMVFQPVESATEAETEAEDYFVHVGRTRQSLSTRFFEKFHLLRRRFSIVYYPLWVGRYEFRKRNYQVVVDGVNGKVLYGKAPGNVFYRAAALVGAMALGNLILVNSCTFLFFFGDSLGDSDDNPLAIVLAIAAAGLGVMWWGYHSFRYGEEVEQQDASAQKVSSASSGGTFNKLIGKGKEDNWLKMGMEFLEELGDRK
ncbi:MAG: hypothetical protein OT477_23075 [Chloroflexi bacterium]|nr:hypothetical protein [Chloroflexota bacterium]